jgi:hypothetical protein
MSLKQKEHAAGYFGYQTRVSEAKQASADGRENVSTRELPKNELPGILQFVPIRDEKGIKVKLSLEDCKLINNRYTTVCKLKEIIVPGNTVHILTGKECLISFKKSDGFTLADLLKRIGYMTSARNKLLQTRIIDCHLVDITYDSENHILVPIFTPNLFE